MHLRFLSSNILINLENPQQNCINKDTNIYIYIYIYIYITIKNRNKKKKLLPEK